MDFDFSFFLVLATFLTGAVWGGYALKCRLQALQRERLEKLAEFSQPGSEDDAAHLGDPHPITRKTLRLLEKEPVVVEYARSFFPIVLIVLLLRSFLVEPFRIPSGSMMPTLLVGDFILVNKYTYGIRLPVLNTKIIEMGAPKRGDIVVFRFPKDPTVDYIKRIVGLPGDRISYYHKQISINGKPMKLTPLGNYEGAGQTGSLPGMELLLAEELDEKNHDILIYKGETPAREGEFVVPQGHYFVMGDNRDNSNDSRFWGAVPEQNLVGKAFFIWMSWDSGKPGIAFNRIGTVLK